MLSPAIIATATQVASTDTVVVLTPGGTGQVIAAAWTLAVFAIGWLVRHFSRSR
jgi:hypothetical protein